MKGEYQEELPPMKFLPGTSGKVAEEYEMQQYTPVPQTGAADDYLEATK